MKFKFLLFSLFLLLGCSVDNSNPFQGGVSFEAIDLELSTDQFHLFEGETKTLSLPLKSSNRGQIALNWEIIGGFGRFATASDFVVVPPRQSSIDIELASLTLPTVNGIQVFPLRVSSVHIEEPVVIQVTVEDTKSPALLEVSDPELAFPTVPLDETSFATLTLTNTGDVAASTLGVTDLSAPFFFKGGAYPGDGGTCALNLQPGQSCDMVFAFTSSVADSYSQDAKITFFNGLENTELAWTLIGNADAVVATMSGLPQSPSKVTTLAVSVAGAGITQYKYKVGPSSGMNCNDSSGYSGNQAVASPINANISGDPDGIMALCVLGFNGTDWQEQASPYLWVKDTTPPSNPSFSINNESLYTNVMTVQLTLFAENASQFFVTNVPGCSSGGVWESYNTAKSWTLTNENGANNIYVKFRDQANNQTACLSQHITHDNVSPTVTINRAPGQPSSTDLTPVSYDVVFSKDIQSSTFTATDLVQEGTATDVQWKVTEITASQYLLEVVGVGEGGSILPKLPEDTILDLAGNANEESTSSDSLVTFDVVEFYFYQVAAGHGMSCAVSNEGQGYCWGTGTSGELGTGQDGTYSTPQPMDTQFISSFKSFRSLQLGFEHSCALDSQGRAYCWGVGANGRLGTGATSAVSSPTAVDVSGISGFRNFRALSVGERHTCGITAKGEGYCWGEAKGGQLGHDYEDFTNLSTFPDELKPISVSTGALPGSQKILEITSGAAHNCALMFDREIYCWGDEEHGKLGGTYAEVQPLPVQVPTSGLGDYKNIIKIASGHSHNCALGASGKVYCWGKGTEGQLGNGMVDSDTPLEVDTSHITNFGGFKDLALGGDHACGLAATGEVYCWGLGTDGQLGHGIQSSSAAVVQVELQAGIGLESIVKINAGANHSCALRADGRAFCWGDGTLGQLGQGALALSTRATAVDIAGLNSKGSLKQVALGASHSCAVSAGARVSCWGEGAQGKLGDGVAADRTKPVSVSLSPQDVSEQFVSVGAGAEHSCGLTADGDAFCWGRNNFGQLGVGNFENSFTPKKVVTQDLPDFGGFKSLSVGALHVCGVDTRGAVYCWGYGLYGQIGDGANANRNKPTPVNTSSIAGFKGFTQVGLGDLHSCGVVASGQAYCWGYGANGRMGHGLIGDKNLPTLVDTTLISNFSGFKSIQPGREHSCAIALDGGAYCWGTGSAGQMGDGNPLDRLTAVPVDTSFLTGFTEFLDLSGGRAHNCATTSRGESVCWGSADFGKIGDGGLTFRVRPVEPATAGLSEYKAALQIAAGGDHTCMIGTFGDSYCWGLGLQGQLGNGDVTPKNLPVRILFP